MSGIDQFIDKYEIVATLGRGSMGVVYKARDPEIGRVVAIKTLRSVFLGQDASGEEALQRFRQEARSAGRLRHPNIVTIFDTGKTSNGSPYIVMEFIEGHSLETIIMERSPIDPLECLHYLGQIGSAIDYAHSQVVIHRDIKPSNVIVSGQGRPHLLDFGVAKLSDTSLTPAGTVVGTPSYMSPEQIRGERLDGATDRFALGVMAFEMFTGIRPFPGNDFTTVVGNIIHKPPISFDEMAIRLPPALEPVLQRAVAKEREKRYPSAQDFVEALGEVFRVAVDAMGVPAYRPGTKLADVASGRAPARTLTQTVNRENYGLPPERKAPPQDFEATATVAAPVVKSGDSLQWDGFSKRRAEVEETSAFEEQDPSILEEDLAAEEEESIADSAPENSGGPTGTGRMSRLTQRDPVAAPPGPNKFGAPSVAVQEERKGVARKFFIGAAVLGIVLVGFLALEFLRSKKTPAPVATEETAPQQETAEVAPVSEEIEKEIPDTQQETATPAPLIPQRVTPDDVPRLDDEELATLLETPEIDPAVLLKSLSEIAKRDLLTFRDSLMRLAVHSNYLVRVESLKVIGKGGGLDDEIFFRVVAGRLADTDRLVRGFAVKTIAAKPSESALAVLQQRLPDEKDEVVLKVLRSAIEKMRVDLDGAKK